MIDSIEKFRGIFVAFYAFYDDSGKVSPERIRRAAQWTVDKGVQGLYLTGSSGEGMLLSPKERKETFEAVMDAVGGKTTVIAHVAANSTEDSCEIARYAAACGVDAISAVPNIYYPLPAECIEANWDAMIDAARLPFIIYNCPATTGANLSMDLFAKMIRKDYVAGIKTTSPDAGMISKFRELSDGKAAIFFGEDKQLLAGLSMGATGGIGGTYGAMPELYVKIYEAYREGRMEDALLWQERASKAFMHGRVPWSSGVACMKAILEARGIPTGGVRKPFLTVAKDEKRILEAAEMIERWLA